MDNQRLPATSPENEPGLSAEENLLLNTPLPVDLKLDEMLAAWDRYQAVIGGLLIRMGMESRMFDSLARTALVGTLEGVYTRIALIPKFSNSALHAVTNHSLSEFYYRLAGECTLMELSAAAGYRTFCFPDLIRGLQKTGKMQGRPVQRMLDTFEFLNTMVQYPLNDERVLAQLDRTNGLHARYKVAGAANQGARDLFKYIALNMFYIGPMMRPDLTPRERHAICGLTVLVSQRMGHSIEGSVHELESFIRHYEANYMFDRDDQSPLRRRAVAIAQASKLAVNEIPAVCPARIHSYVPYAVKRILEIE